MAEEPPPYRPVPRPRPKPVREPGRFTLPLLAAVIGVVAVGAVVALLVAVGQTRDPVPGQLRTCVQDADAVLVRGPNTLGGLRRDLGTGAVRQVGAPVKLGEDTAVLLAGTRYRLLVLAGKDSPPLGEGLPERVYRGAGQYALVALEADPVNGILKGCVDFVRADG